MNKITATSNIDVLLIYQDKESVKHVIQQLQDIALSFKTLIFDHNRVSDILMLRPKLILLSSNNIMSTIKFYIEFLEKYEDKINAHAAILLINNKEAPKAYLACQQGLFDNYVITNPMIEPYRLKLILQQTLKLVKPADNEKINELFAACDDELANCISYGSDLKSQLKAKIRDYQHSITHATNEQPIENEAKDVLNRIVAMSFEELNQDISLKIQNILNQMLDVKAIHNTLNLRVDKHLQSNRLAANSAKVNLSALHNQSEATSLPQQPQQYRLLIAEHSELYTNLIAEMFDDSQFDYRIAQDGIEALLQFEEFKPDVILLSYDLPKVDGIEVTRRIRDKGAKTPIVAFSQHHDKKLINQWIPLGLSGYIIKPSTKNNIINTIVQAIQAKAAIINHHHSNNATRIEWIPAYSVGNELIDMQHKMLFSLINDFFNHSNSDDLISVFEKLADYIKTHFVAEEKLMKELHYPKLAEHKQKHSALIEKFALIEKKLQHYNEVNHHKIGLFLYNWLAKHILKEDMEYKPFTVSQTSAANSNY